MPSLTTHNTPALRFPGYTGVWEQKQFNKLYRKSSQKNDLTYGPDQVISVANMYYKTDTTIHSEDYLKTYNIFELGDIAFEGHKSKDFQSGRFVENTIGNGIVSHVFDVFKPISSYDLQFWKYYIHNEQIMSPILLRSTKASLMMNNLIADDFLKESIRVPSLSEQQKIGSFFHHLDGLINLHQRQTQKLTELKQGLLQNMFPREGESVPRLRFPGFTTHWKQQKLGDIGKTYTGLSGKSKTDFGHGKAHFVTYMNVYSHPVADINQVDSCEIDSKQHEVQYGDVFFTTSSETPDEVGMSSVWLGNIENTYLNSFCFGYRPDQQMDPYFMAYILRSPTLRDQFILLAQGISRYNISKNKAMDIKLSLPSLSEQQKIGSFFHHFDDLINLHERYVMILIHLKKGLLQKMFPQD